MMLPKTRKSQMTAMRGLIIFLVVAIVLLVFYVGVISLLQDEADRELCRTSVLAKLGGNLASFGLSESSITLQCYTQQVQVRSDGIYKSGKKTKMVKIQDFPESYGGGSEDLKNRKIELVQLAIANEMYDCWYQFYEGKLAIFTDGERCVVCSEISFEEDWIDPEKRLDSFGNFDMFLMTTKIPGSKQTYADYFGKNFVAPQGVLTTAKTSVIFRAVAKSWWNDLKSKMFTTGAGTTLCVGGSLVAAPFTGGLSIAAGVGCLVGGVVSGVYDVASSKSEFIPSLLIGPENIVSGKCDKLY